MTEGRASLRIALASTFLALLGATAPVQADSITLGAVADNTIYSENVSQSNGAGNGFFAGRTNLGGTRRALIQFDLSGIPAGSTVTGVTLTLYQSRTQGGTQSVSLHRTLESWGEGTSHAPGEEGGGAPASTGDATWKHRFFNTVRWTTDGGEFAPTASATRSVGSAYTFYTWSSAGMITDAQGWVDDPSNNHGWIIRGNETTTRTSKRFESRQSTSPSLRPTLTVVYTPASGPSGACCLPGGECQVLGEAACTSAGGLYQGDDAPCDPNPCPLPTGACCFVDGTCQVLTAADCAAGAGSYQGDDIACEPQLCPVTLTPFVDALPIPAAATPTSGTQGGEATYDIAMMQVQQQLHRDLPPTTLWAYDGTYPGPTILATRDQPVTVNWINDLRYPDSSYRTDHYLSVETCVHGGENLPKAVVHLHGGHVPAAYDGYPEFTYLPGYYETYVYPNNQLPSMIWYHDHALGITRLNVYMGLAGGYVIRDDFENGLNLPGGAYEVPLIIQDRTFNPDGSLYYPDQYVEHFFGDKMLVNGMVWPYLNVDQGKYRFRVLNGCNSRTLTLSLSNGASFQKIGTDGGLLPEPLTLSEITLVGAERADLIVDFAGYAAGTEIRLVNSAPAPFPGTPGVGVVPDVMKFVVQAVAGDTDPVPTALRPIETLDPNDAVADREFILQKIADPGCTGSSWRINGLHWNAITEYPRLGTTETWNFINRSGMSHPMHMHLVFFQVVSSQLFEVVGDEIVPIGDPIPATPEQQGWRDTVEVPPSTIVKVIARFEDYSGLYAYHCHILEHEDHEMMRQYFAVFFGDSEPDGDVDFADFEALLDCLAGPGITPAPPPPTTLEQCLSAFDSDYDGDVDILNLAELQVNFTGP